LKKVKVCSIISLESKFNRGVVMKKSDKTLEKYYVNRKLSTSVCVITIGIVVLYLAVISLINNIEQQNLFYQICLVAKEVLVVLFSIMGTTILTTWLIEVDGKNNIYRDVVCNGFLASKEFYEALPVENREVMLKNLEDNIYFGGNKVKEKMYKSIINKLQEQEYDYYYNECKYSVNCKIENGLITSTVKKTLKIRNFEGNGVIKRLRISNSVFKQIEGIKNLELLQLKINNKKISVKEADGEIEIEKSNDISEQLKSCGYDTSLSYFYSRPIPIEDNKDCVIEVEYRSIVNVNDNSFSFRMSKPCRSFAMEYRLNNGCAQEYSLSSCAFGFEDDAITSVHNCSRDFVTVRFNDWIYVADGVVVVITRN
jgi:hypothetical protein